MPPESNVESTLIWYRANDEGNYKYWTDELDKFLEGKQCYLYCRIEYTSLYALEQKSVHCLVTGLSSAKIALARQIVERILTLNFMKI